MTGESTFLKLLKRFEKRGILKEKLWQELIKREPEEVAQKAKVVYQTELKVFYLLSLGQTFQVSPMEREISPLTSLGKLLYQRFKYLIDLTFLFYLLRADGRGLNGKYLSYKSLKGGETFFRGSHTLSFSKLLKVFECAPQELDLAAEKLGGKKIDLGDLAYEFTALPLLPLVLSFWKGEEEIPSSANLLFDASVEDFLPLDLLWAVSAYVVNALSLVLKES